MPDQEDKYNLKEKSNNELHEWLTHYKPGSDEYEAGINESMRRVASLEELMEKSEAPSRKREAIALFIAMIALVIAIIFISLTY
ncbi:MAG: hypothetical protein LJE83_15200 [Gammaproteobacteria bacterium]|nr:hypothetical protein [Gammaproteobacteria bacterium]